MLGLISYSPMGPITMPDLAEELKEVVLKGTILYEMNEQFTAIEAKNLKELQAKISNSKLDSSQFYFVILKNPEAYWFLDTAKEDRRATEYNIFIMTKDGIEASEYSITHHCITKKNCLFVLNVLHHRDEGIYIANRGVNKEYRRRGVMKQTSINFLDYLYNKNIPPSNFKVQSSPMHPATWKFFHSKKIRDVGLPNKHDLFNLSSGGRTIHASVEELFTYHPEQVAICRPHAANEKSENSQKKFNP